MKYRMISGYLSVMRMQRAHMRAIAAGSTLVVKCNENTELDEIIYIGGRQNEGFGKVRVFKVGEWMKGDTENHLTMNSVSSKSHNDIKRMFEMLQKDEKMRNDAISYALENKKRFEDKWGAAFIGRVTLMRKQADSEPDFENRIKSVKSTS